MRLNRKKNYLKLLNGKTYRINRKFIFLAHLSQRLIGELIGYPWSDVVVRPQFQTSSLKPLGQSKPNFMWSLLGKWGIKFYINGPGHVTKKAFTPIYGKNLLLQNRKSYDFETWHVASGTQLYKVYINDYPGLTLTYFTAWSN